MNNLMTVQTLGPQLMALLGLPKNVTSFVLRCAAGELVTVRCEYHPGDAFGIDAVLADYELVPRTSAPADLIDAMGFDAWMRQRNDAAHKAMMAACFPATPFASFKRRRGAAPLAANSLTN